MGVIKLFSSSSFDEPSGSIFSIKAKRSSSNFDTVVKYESLPNPRPDNYTIIRSKVIEGYLVIEIKYHDCTNYEGKKIMIFECSLNDLKKQKLIDPHFCDNENYFSPIARFEPTERGWLNACAMANVL